jgi:2-keto-4-pentenoate hydratase/2-oxohepta-3-ene-1,7-dioic acid hydratase in catechol pathway
VHADKVVDASTAAKAADIRAASSWITNRDIIQFPLDEQLALERAARILANSEQSSAHVFPINDLRLGPPIPDPDKIVCLGLNYRSHAEEAGFSIPTVPILFAKYPA